MNNVRQEILWLLLVGLVTGIPTTVEIAEKENIDTVQSIHPNTENSGLKWISLQQGDIYTQEELAGDGQTKFYAFRGIPYAQPPVGHLRLQDPLAAGPWEGARNGSFLAPVCPQANRTENGAMIGDEDCLYLNIFTKNPSHSGMPVMVFIHGGGFLHGGMDIYPPEPLVTRDVVLVTIQYRLGTLGFLSTEDSVLPGNLGLKDQSLALHWVQDNIKEFGGDPQRVTVFGVSAGAAAAHLQVLSPVSKGLFHRVILQSGTAICPWSIDEGHRQVAMKIGRNLNCSGFDSPSELSSSKRLLHCLQEASVKELVMAPTNFFVSRNLTKDSIPSLT